MWTTAGAPAWAKHAVVAPQDQANNLIYHGGAVQHHPKVYLIFWGTQWKDGFRGGPHNAYTNKTAMAYETAFFKGVGGTPWHGVQSQFCDGAPVGSFSCGELPKSNFVANEKNVLKGVWLDPSAAPAVITATVGQAENGTTDPVAAEAIKASQHFHDTNPDSLFMVFAPPAGTAPGYGTAYCAYHAEVVPQGMGHGIRFSYMPYTPEQGAGCGGNSVNRENNAFGNGYLDSYSLAGGHEFEEAVTDPDGIPFQDGWNDYQTSENGDKCAYFHSANLKHGTHVFAVQPMWSNEANGGKGGCAMHRGTGAFPVPSTP
jgi:hypothetical protein